jgi:glucose/arabinose dehydrogenase
MTRRRLARGATVLTAGLIAASACSFGASTESTTATTARKASAGTAPPSSLPAELFGPTSLEGLTVKLTEVGTVDDPAAITGRSGSPNLYVAERPGRIRQLTVVPVKAFDGTTTIRKDAFVERGNLVDLSREISTDGEGGLVGMTFSSDGRKLYVSFVDRGGALRLVEHKVNDDRIDPRTRRDVLTVPLPSPTRVGGQLAAGPDGFVYVGIGDGGDPNAAQDPTSLLGKVLRIDPEGALGDIAYAVPDSNPYRDGSEGAPEVWLVGTRDPRLTFDETSGDLWVVDNGDQVAELTLLPGFGGQAGREANLGATVMDGSRSPTGAAPPDGHIAPIFEYTDDRPECGAVAGYPYRGEAMPALAGAYVYGDRCTGEVRGVRLSNAKASDERSLGAGVAPGSLVAFGQDTDGELWVVASTGQVLRIDPV